MTKHNQPTMRKRMNTPTDTVDFVTPEHAAGRDRPESPSALARVDVCGLSHPGRERPNNEDHFFVARFGRFLERLFTNLSPEEVSGRFEETGYGMVVADGIGGSAAGEVASKLAIRTLVNLVLGTPDWILRLDDELLPAEVRRRARDRYEQIGTVMAEQAQADPALHGFGTTMTMALSLGQDLFLTHVGDSRAYLLRQERLCRVTRDHTLAQALADQGLLAQPEVATHRYRHVLTKALSGRGGHVEPDVQEMVLQDGDCLLLCTDGLTDMLTDTRIAEVQRSGETAEKTCQCLVEEALNAGGKDNVTVIVARYGFPPSPNV
jgi:protein phosphatase